MERDVRSEELVLVLWNASRDRNEECLDLLDAEDFTDPDSRATYEAFRAGRPVEVAELGMSPEFTPEHLDSALLDCLKRLRRYRRVREKAA
jgi:hypothetical protein